MINVKVDTLQKNQYIINIYDTINNTKEIIFQSYNSIIARIDKDYELTIYKDINYSKINDNNLSYSKTTEKYLNQFLEIEPWNNDIYYNDLIIINKLKPTQAIEKLINSGKIIKGF